MTAWPPEGWLSAGGRRLHVLRWGPPPEAAPTLVLLHEGLGSAGLWRDWPGALARATGLGVLAYSRAGYGRSAVADLPRPLDYMTREAVDVLPAVLDAAGVRLAVTVGHSDGATIAAIHAGTVADPRLRGTVLMAPHFFTEPAGLAEIARARDAYEDGLRDRLARHHDAVDVAFRGWNDAWLDPGFRDWDVRDALDGIAVPVLAVQGRDDPYGTLAQIDVVAARCPGPVERLVLDACGHAPFRDHPEAVTEAVARHAAGALAVRA